MSEQDIEPLLEKSLELTAAGRHEENATLMRSAVVRFPDDPEVLLRTAVALGASEEEEEAMALAVRAASLAADDPGILFRVGSLLFSLGDLDAATSYVKQARSLVTEDFVFLPDLLHLTGRIALAKGNDVGAERALALAFEADPGARGHGSALAWFYFDRGRLDEARAVVERATPHAADDDADLDAVRAAVARVRRLTGHGP